LVTPFLPFGEPPPPPQPHPRGAFFGTSVFWSNQNKKRFSIPPRLGGFLGLGSAHTTFFFRSFFPPNGVFGRKLSGELFFFPPPKPHPPPPPPPHTAIKHSRPWVMAQGVNFGVGMVALVFLVGWFLFFLFCVFLGGGGPHFFFVQRAQGGLVAFPTFALTFFLKSSFFSLKSPWVGGLTKKGPWDKRVFVLVFVGSFGIFTTRGLPGGPHLVCGVC